MKRREKTSGSSWNGQGLPTVVPSSSRSRSASPYKRAPFDRMVSFRRQRRGGLQLCDWIHLLFVFCILGAVYKIVRWLQESTFETEAAEYSSLTVHVSSSGTGLMNKYFYRFRNVRILRGRMKFFYDPAGPFVPPTEELWVDIISSNATSAQPPTMLVIKVDAPTRWQYLPIDYISVTNGAGACHARATPVVKRPAYLLQVRYSYNIWHTWGEAGLMSLFQTLREMNLLSIATVGPSGTLNELGHGSTASWGDASGLSRVAVDDQETGCPWTYDHVLQRAIRHESCDKVRLPHGATCSPHSQAWCRPGAVVSPLRDSPAAPLIVTYTPQSTKNIWSHLYNTISSNQKTLDDLDGACFEDLIVGKSSTLNFYQALNTTDPAATILEKVPRIDNSKARVESMAIFKAFIISSQREWVERNGLAFEGYDDPGLDLLRQGVVRPDIETLDAINPKECIGNIREEIGELKRNFEAHEALVAPVILDYERKYGPILVPSSLSSQSALKLRDEESEGYFALRDAVRVGAVNTGEQVENSGDGRKTEAPVAAARTADLPIVTYMSRNFFSRGVINEAAILKYLLLNYNVVLKVTTFQEPLGDVMDILSTSDVIFGMHGAGWTNLLFVVASNLASRRPRSLHRPAYFDSFMKQGATAMQMFPHGWRLPDNSTVRGYNYREIVYASEGKYLEWVNPMPENAYFRRIDFKKKAESQFALHPGDNEASPTDSWPGNQWIYQNTFVDLDTSDFRDALHEMMRTAGIPRSPGRESIDEDT